MDVRSQFPMLSTSVHGHPFIYLDSAATAQKPLAVIDTISDFYKHHYGTVHRAIYKTAQDAGDRYQESRKTVQKFINAKSEDEIIFTRGTTDGINCVAATFPIHEGDEIIITEMEHHSNIVAWQMCAERNRAILKVVPFFDNGELDLEAFHSLLTDRTKIVAVTHLSNVLGTINPIAEIVKASHKVGAKVLVDGAQSAPHIPIDVQAMDVDFFVFSGHKVYGPTGIGVLYGKYELLNQMPPYQGGGDMIETVTFEKTTYNVLPLKFEAGTPMIAEVIGLKAALDYVMELGISNIAAYEHTLLELLWNELSTIPNLHIMGANQNRGSLVTFTVDGCHPLDIATLLDLQGIAIRSGHLCAQPVMRHFGHQGACRASVAFYNTQEEIWTFSQKLKKVIARAS
ncbi:MAG: cysteine desulfurase [Verrucomicrobia bacterium]|nr:cysteine desulfurase [Verrucomicrobiota bacterium]